MPWRNGAGTTTEIVRQPDAVAGDQSFDWRLSVADVAADGPFSRFDGIDRILVLLSGEGMDLHFPDEVVTLRPPYGRHSFPGEADVHATLTGGPTTDLNLMCRRDRWSATVDWLEAPCRIDAPDEAGSRLVVFVAGGSARLPGGEDLGRGDVVERGGALLLSGDASLLVFALRPVAAGRP